MSPEMSGRVLAHPTETIGVYASMLTQGVPAGLLFRGPKLWLSVIPFYYPSRRVMICPGVCLT